MKNLKTILSALLLTLFLSLSFNAQATSLTDYYENVIVDHLFRATALSETVPANYFIALHTAACSDSATGTEATGGSYARVTVTRGTANWNGTHGNTTGASSGTNGTISNAAVITFPAPTANWGLVTHFAIWDAVSAGNQIICEALTVSKTINNGDAAPSFAAGALTVQIDN